MLIILTLSFYMLVLEMGIEFLLNMNVCYLTICCRIYIYRTYIIENFMRISFSHSVHNSNSSMVRYIREKSMSFIGFIEHVSSLRSMEHIFIELYEHMISFKVIFMYIRFYLYRGNLFH